VIQNYKVILTQIRSLIKVMQGQLPMPQPHIAARWLRQNPIKKNFLVVLPRKKFSQKKTSWCSLGRSSRDKIAED